MKTEWFERWEPVDGIETPVACAVVKDNAGLSIVLVFSGIVGGLKSDLQLSFENVPAYAVYEEFSHPWQFNETEPPPYLTGRWERHAFPMLIVKNSVWLDSFSDSQLVNYPDCVHYRLVTLDKTVDILSNRTPKVSWLTPAADV